MVTLEEFKKFSQEGQPARIIFPEGDDERILKAASQTSKEKIIKPILAGQKEKIKAAAQNFGVSLEGVEIVDPEESAKRLLYAQEYSKLTNTSLPVAEKIFLNPLFYATAALKAGEADGMIAGAVFTSGEVITVSRQIIGLKTGISVPSSFFLMMIPNYSGGEGGSLIFADASVNVSPKPEELADIAITTGETAQTLFSWQPRIALLSFSTKGSAVNYYACKVKEAAEIAKEKAPQLAIDGELQADAALVMETAKKKMKDVGETAGRANILIFPDLNAGNIAYKLVSILAGAQALGPILQGFNRPVSDLSRGAKTEEIVKIITLLAGWIKKTKTSR